MKPEIITFFDETTFTASHLVVDRQTNKAAIIDSVLDYDQASGRSSTTSADRVIDTITERGLALEWILETHVHADHLSAAPYLKEKLGGKTGIGDKVPLIQNTFGDIFNAEQGFCRDGRQFDVLFADGQTFQIGEMNAQVLHTPGHTPACITYEIGDAAFVGDTLFMPDYGTARCDFPGGDARALYRSIQKILTLPNETRIFICHDYKAPGRDKFAWQSTVAEQRASNLHIGGDVSEDAFVVMREKRDALLSMPRLILPSVQVNMRAGYFPPPEDNGVSYLKIPVNTL